MFKRATYHDIPCWFNQKTGELHGRNWFYDLIVEFNLWLDVHVFEVDEFQIWIEDD
jgi:hypothetical protein